MRIMWEGFADVLLLIAYKSAIPCLAEVAAHKDYLLPLGPMICLCHPLFPSSLSWIGFMHCWWLLELVMMARLVGGGINTEHRAHVTKKG